MTRPATNRRSLRTRAAGCWAAVALALWASAAAAVQIDSAMEIDPRFEPPRFVRRFAPKLKPLWLEALKRPEADLKRQAADAIARAQRRGMPGLADAVPALVEALEASDRPAVVGLAAARALVELDARQAAPLLAKHAAADPFDMARLVEPVLARWDYAPAREIWLRRLEDPRTTHGLQVLAIEGLRTVGEVRALPRLRQMAGDGNHPADLRLKAAGTVGVLRPEGLEGDARPLAADKSPARIIDRLAAAMLLARHRGGPAQALLLEFAADPEPAVAAIALGRLVEIDPKLVAMPMLRGLVASPDANVRHLAAKLLAGHRTPEAMTLLGTMLDDEHPAVRGCARDALVERAAVADLDPVIRRAAMEMLSTTRWRGLEQAAMVLGALDHEPAAGRLVELLEFPRSEVYIAAAWALRRLAVPATAAAIFDKVRRETDRTEAIDKLPLQRDPSLALDRIRPVHDQLEQLIQALGVIRYGQSETLLGRFSPKPPPPPLMMPPPVAATKQERLRAAALWSLGLLYTDRPNEGLAGTLAARVNDEGGDNPESPLVRRVAAVSLGRMKAASAVPVLRNHYGKPTAESMLRNACGWSLRRITGEQLPEVEPTLVEAYEADWFLVPLD